VKLRALSSAREGPGSGHPDAERDRQDVGCVPDTTGCAASHAGSAPR
jgi:hypothetical protein